MGDPDGGEIDINPRSARDLGERILVLSAICRRSFLESAHPDETDDPEGDRFDLLAWLHDEASDGAATQSERRALSTQVGALSGPERSEASWRVEALQALMWAGSLAQTLPDPWVEADAAAILAALPAPFDRPRPLLEALAIRDDESLAVERERAEIWLWRATVADELATASANERRELHALISDVASAARANGLLPATDRDLLVVGQPFSATTPAMLGRIAAVSAERLHALNWTCGFGDGWDDVPLDV